MSIRSGDSKQAQFFADRVVYNAQTNCQEIKWGSTFTWFCYGMPLSDCLLGKYRILKINCLLGLQLGDGCNKKIKKITIFKRTLLAFRYKLYGDFE